MKLLVAENDTYLSNALQTALVRNGYEVSLESDGAGVLTTICGAQHSYDLLILDLGLPKINGFDVIRNLRQQGKDISVLVLSGRDSLSDRVRAFDLGANGFVTKPFVMEELQARIKAIIGPNKNLQQNEIKLGDIAFNLRDKSLSVRNVPLLLTAMETEVFEILLSNRGKTVPQYKILSLISSSDRKVSENAIRITLHRLRKKLENSGVEIKSNRNLGYLLETC